MIRDVADARIRVAATLITNGSRQVGRRRRVRSGLLALLAMMVVASSAAPAMAFANDNIYAEDLAAAKRGLERAQDRRAFAHAESASRWWRPIARRGRP